MFEYFKFQYQLSKLFKERRSINEKIALPKENEKFTPLGDEFDQLERVEHKIYRLTTDYYWEQALRFGVPVPDDKEYWDESKVYLETEHLNRKGISTLKNSIHESKKRTLEIVSVWVAGLTGLVGAVTGLIAIILSKG